MMKSRLEQISSIFSIFSISSISSSCYFADKSLSIAKKRAERNQLGRALKNYRKARYYYKKAGMNWKIEEFISDYYLIKNLLDKRKWRNR